MALNLDYPDGLAHVHVAPRGPLHGYANLLSIVVLSAVMVVALSGLLAGDRTVPRVATLTDARIEVTVPQRLRNGEMFEMRVKVTATAPIADATIALPPGLWRDMTINTMIPAASEEAFKDGSFRFRYGALNQGESLEIKIDGQINPPLTLGTSGDVTLYDGERRLGAMPVHIRVLP